MVASIGKIASPPQGVSYDMLAGYYVKDDPVRQRRRDPAPPVRDDTLFALKLVLSPAIVGGDDRIVEAHDRAVGIDLMPRAIALASRLPPPYIPSGLEEG